MITSNHAYAASPVRSSANDNVPRHRATKEEMSKRAAFLVHYDWKHSPVTVRQLFYAATVKGVPGITKDDNGYNAIQRQVLQLRREGAMPYRHIADLTRFARQPAAHNSIWDALDDTAEFYRRALWRDKAERVEVWCEKDALAGCIQPITAEYAVPLMVCRGFTSETFAYEAVESWAQSGKPTYVYHLGDFDRSGQDAAADLERKLMGFAAVRGVECHFTKLALTADMVRTFGLPTRPPKRETAADRRWPYDFACELDAIPPAMLREIVREVLSAHLPDEELAVLLAAEESERSILRVLAEYSRGAPA